MLTTSKAVLKKFEQAGCEIKYTEKRRLAQIAEHSSPDQC
jgi:hypothetical protein